MTSPPVLATYRLQLRADGCTFADAEALLDYLGDLGVSHLYLSPILTAVDGSTHGYDVTDPTRVSEALGGADGLARLASAARRHRMGLIVDIVPNHVGVDTPTQNRWWWDVLKRGRTSAFAGFFDIDWSRNNGADGKLAIPVLDDDGDLHRLRVDDDVLRLGALTFPIAAGTAAGSGPQVHDRQHYRLVGWRRGPCTYRRFFAVSSLAALRQENAEVFHASHTEVRRWLAAGLVDGLRVDHPDGLSDPAGYLHRLRALTGPDAWIVIEKILAVDEALDTDLPVAGTTGYDALREIGGLFVDPAGAGALTDLAAAAGEECIATPRLTRALKTRAVTHTLASETARLRRAVAGAVADHPLLPEAIAELVSRIGVYRSDYRGLWPVTSAALAGSAAARPELGEALGILAAALTTGTTGQRDDTGNECVARLQQLCGAATAKALEDCLFYRDPRLVSLNEVGGAPERFAVSAAEVHHRNATRARLWPQTMTALSTHDTKRGEDVRARIGVLSQVPTLWADSVARWTERIPPPDLGTCLFLWQNIFGVWPAAGPVTDQLRARLHAYAAKAIREAARHTSWHSPNPDFEAAVHRWLAAVIQGDTADEMTALAAKLDPHARSDALGQKLVQLTAPGIPDVYQGTELWDDSLVDPDNRRPVDFVARRAALAALEHPKMRVTTAALRLRRRRPEVFVDGGYTALLAGGAAGRHLVSFMRGAEVVAAVSRWTVRLAETGWGDTVLRLPPGRWTDVVGGRTHAGPAPASELFTDLPVALLERDG